MKSKKILILSILIIILALLSILIMHKFKMKDEDTINKIHYDMKITYNHMIEDTGYGTEYDFDLIDIDNKKAYLVHDFDVWGNETNPLKKGHNYRINTIDLTENDIVKLLNISEMESNESLKDAYNKEYLTIEYNGKTIYLDNIVIEYDNK